MHDAVPLVAPRKVGQAALVLLDGGEGGLVLLPAVPQVLLVARQVWVNLDDGLNSRKETSKGSKQMRTARGSTSLEVGGAHVLPHWQCRSYERAYCTIPLRAEAGCQTAGTSSLACSRLSSYQALLRR